MIKEYERLVFTICYSFVKNYFDAENLAQETFLSAYKNIGKFSGGNFKGWLCTIAANKCRDFLKAKANNVISLYEDEMDRLEDESNLPEDIIMEKEMERQIQLLCNKLKDPYKTVAINYFCKDLKLSEVAASTGQNLKTVQMQLYRAKKQLRKMWEVEYNEKSC